MSLVLQGHDLIREWNDKWKDVYKEKDPNNNDRREEQNERKYFKNTNSQKRGKLFDISSKKTTTNNNNNIPKTPQPQRVMTEQPEPPQNLLDFDIPSVVNNVVQNNINTNNNEQNSGKPKAGFSFIKKKKQEENKTNNDTLNVENNQPVHSNTNNNNNEGSNKKGFSFIKKNKKTVNTPQPTRTQLEDIFNPIPSTGTTQNQNDLQNIFAQIPIENHQSEVNQTNIVNRNIINNNDNNNMLLGLTEEEIQKEDKMKSLSENLFKAYNTPKEEIKNEKKNAKYDDIMYMNCQPNNMYMQPQPNMNNNNMYMMNNGYPINNMYMNNYMMSGGMNYQYRNPYMGGIGIELYNDPNKKKEEPIPTVNYTYNTNFYNDNKKEKKEVDPFGGLVSFK